MSTNKKRIVYIDNTDPAVLEECDIIGINVIATAGTHSIVLKDNNGNIFFEHNNNSPAPVQSKVFKVNGIIPTTLTNARVIIWLDI